MATTGYAYTGAPVSFTVPVGVTGITVDAWGANGGGASGALGGRVQALLSVTPGEVLWLYVGGRGALQGGWNGGGQSGASGVYGGGATDIRRGGQALTNRILVAPGGGASAPSGAFGGGGGGASGLPGQNGSTGRPGGAGATQTAGAALGVGGTSVLVENVGGGGGGGFYGGYAGASGAPGEPAGGGGGGSALLPVGATTSTGGALTADARITFSYNQPPSAPTLLVSNGEALNKDATNRLPWQHADPDGDGQSGYDLRYRIVGAATWTTLNGSTPNQYRDIPAGTFAAGSYEWQVRTYDPAGLVGPYSGSGFFTAAPAPAGPAITAPVNGETIGAATGTLTWTAAAQTRYQVQILADLAGAPDLTSAAVFDSGWISDAAARSLVLSFPVNSMHRHIRVRVEDAGVPSTWAIVRVLVSYTLPATALHSVVAVKTIDLPGDFTDALETTILNPAPTNGQPARAYNRIWITALSPGDHYRPMGVRKLAAAQFVGSIFTDHRVASGVLYGVEVETIASNGTASMSELVAEFRDLGTGGGGTPGAEGDYADADYAPADFA